MKYLIGICFLFIFASCDTQQEDEYFVACRFSNVIQKVNEMPKEHEPIDILEGEMYCEIILHEPIQTYYGGTSYNRVYKTLDFNDIKNISEHIDNEVKKLCNFILTSYGTIEFEVDGLDQVIFGYKFKCY